MYDVETLSKKFKITDKDRLAKQIYLEELWEVGDKNRGIKPANSSIIGITGFGKSIIGIIALLKNNDKGRSGLVVVPTSPLKDDWIKKLKRFGLEDVDVHTVQHFNSKNSANYYYDLIIFDEVHLYPKGQVFKKIFDIRYKYSMGLTATPPDDEAYVFLVNKIPIIAQVGWDEVKSYISDFEILIYPVYCTQSECVQQDRWGSTFAAGLAKAGSFGDISRIMSDKDFRQRLSYDTGISEQGLFGIAQGSLNAMRQRKNMMYKHPAKLERALEIVDHHSDKNIITFSQTQDFVENLTEAMGNRSRSYHSKMTKKQREEVIQNFRHHRGKTTVINSAMALNQGVDIPKIDIALILSYVSKNQAFVQRVNYLPFSG